MNERLGVESWGGLTRSGSPSEILSQPFVDGIYEVHFGKNHLYMKVKNAKYVQNSESLLFCLNAAISARKGKKPPYFTGDSLSNSLKCCLISFSDPSTHLTDIDLGWYIGNEAWLTFQRDLALFIDQCSLALNKSIILFGGSGGGFASIALSLHIKQKVMAISMNPQLNISAYPSANKYSVHAFPSSNISNVQTFKDNLKEWLAFFDRNHLIATVTKTDLNPNCDYLLLQSWNDTHHLRNHTPLLVPQISDLTLTNFYGTENNLTHFLGPWGDRHSVVWRSHLELILNSALRGKSAEIIGTILASQFLPKNPDTSQIPSQINFPPEINVDFLEQGFPLVRFDFSIIEDSAVLESEVLGLKFLNPLLRPNQSNLDVYAVVFALKCWQDAREENKNYEESLWNREHLLNRINVLEYLCEEYESRPALQHYRTPLGVILREHLEKFRLLDVGSNDNLERWLIQLEQI